MWDSLMLWGKATRIGARARQSGYALAIALLLPLLLAAPRPLAATTLRIVANTAQLTTEQGRTTFVMDFTAPVRFQVSTLANPYRVLIDLDQVDFKLPKKAGQTGAGVVKAFRYGLFATGKSRVVLDTDGPVIIEQSWMMKRGTRSTLVLDLKPTTAEKFAALRNARRSGTTEPAEPTARRIKPRNARRVVVIDPGHGGIDSGAISAQQTQEKGLVLAFARTLAAQIRKQGKYEVRMTRTRDVFVSLRGRVRFARRVGADLFISIHADKVPARFRGVRGATVYTLSERGSDAVANELAGRENRSDLIAGIETADQSDLVTSILVDLAQRETKSRSVHFAAATLAKLRGATRLNKKPHRSAAFRVLKAPDVPSVLIELGYLSNQDDEKLLNSPAWRRKVARSVARAVKSYFTSRRGRIPY